MRCFLEYIIDINKNIKHRCITSTTIRNITDTREASGIKTLVDTGAYNTMIDIKLVKDFGILLPEKYNMGVTIGGHTEDVRCCILHNVEIGGFRMSNVFAMTAQFTDWLEGYIILGANVLNNWNYTVSRTNNTITIREDYPQYLPNKNKPYQNYFSKGEYVAYQEEIPLAKSAIFSK